MAGTHGELYCEIGRLVVAASGGEAMDLTAASEDLSERYANLGVPADMMARAIARSLGAVGVSMALISSPGRRGGAVDLAARDPEGTEMGGAFDPDDDVPRTASTLFPSGVRLALLS